MEMSELFSNQFIVQWNDDMQSLLIIHPDGAKFPHPLVQIRSSTLTEMNCQEASQFIGERLVLLIPALRELYVNPETGSLRESSAP
jgi:hypothetical protein